MPSFSPSPMNFVRAQRWDLGAGLYLPPPSSAGPYLRKTIRCTSLHCAYLAAVRTVFLLTYLLGMRMALERMGVFVVLKDGPTAIFFTICTIVLHLWLTAFLLADARPGLSTRQRLQLQVDDRLRETQWVLTVVIPGIMNAAVYLCFAARCVGLMSGMVWTALLVGLFVVVAAGLYWFARMREQYDMMRRWEVIVLLVTCWLIAAYFPLEGLLRKAVPSLHVLVMRAADLGLMVALRHVVRSWLAAWLDEPRRE